MSWARLAPLDPTTPDYEHLEQVRFFDLLSNVNHPAAENTYAVPNQAVAKLRSFPARNRYFKEGVKGGVPDINTDYPHGQHHGLRIEMKRPGERPRKDQLAWHARLRRAGYCVAVCYSAMEAFRAWLDYLDLDATFF